MPIALEPGGRYPVVLESDKDKENPPTFFFKALNGRQARIVAGVSDALETCKKADELFDRVYDAVKAGLVDWENMIGPDGDIPYDPEKIEDVVGPGEAQELIQASLAVGKPDPKN